MPMADGHFLPESDQRPFQADLNIFWCLDCNVVQTLNDIDLSDYYEDYDYTVSSSPFVHDFMQRFAAEVVKLAGLKRGDSVVEVGSGDGYQLNCFRDLGMNVLGFEPSIGLAKEAQKNGINTVVSYFDDNHLDQIPLDFKQTKVVISQYTFDHIPEPIIFLKDVLKILDPRDGIIVIEVHDFEKIVKRNEACLFTHEHFTYLTEDSFSSVLKQAGYKLVAANFIPENICRGNSLIIAASPINSQIPELKQEQRELLLKLRQKDFYDQISDSIINGHQQLANHVRYLRSQNKRVAGYGAAGRGVNTLAIAGLTQEDVKCVYDMNSNLHGLLMPGVNIPVKHPKQLFEDNIDELIVFSYGYIEEIKEYYSEFINSGGRIISVLEYLDNQYQVK